MDYDVVIGLEVHAQLSTKTKAWCQCEVSAAAFENSLVCEICSGQPGSLPVYNREAVEYAIKLALATDSKLNKISTFDRKSYFYPDLPKGYQITQFYTPIAENGVLEILNETGALKKIRIQRIQLEEDSGKSIHKGDRSLINLNRAGTPLLEIVSEADMSTSKEASRYLKKLHSILICLGISKGNMEEGHFRCDVNVSLKAKGSKAVGTRTEIKNLNSFRYVEMAIEYELKRQQEILDAGKKVLQETMLFDRRLKQTKVLRTKTLVDDYRYIPDPDLLPICISDEQILKIRQNLPELPDAKMKRFISSYGIPAYDADVLTAESELASYFEEAMIGLKGEPKKMSNWIMTELLCYLNDTDTSLANFPVSPSSLANLLNAINDGRISGKMGKDVFAKMCNTGLDSEKVISEMGLKQISDVKLITELARNIIASNRSNVEKYKSGNDRVLGFFVGQIMKETSGQVNPELTAEILKKVLGKE